MQSQSVGGCNQHLPNWSPVRSLHGQYSGRQLLPHGAASQPACVLTGLYLNYFTVGLLQGKLILWRCVFVTHLLVILVLGSFAWGMSEGLSLDRRRAEAFNVLVFGEIGYAVTTRFIKASTFHPR